jgi:putrescine transport system substrate-binding protein
MHRITPRLFGAVAAAAFALPGVAQAETVNIYNWSDYIGETTLADFTAATGIEAVYDTYDNNEVMEAKLLAGNSGYDIVVPTAQPFLSRQVKAGLYLELDRSKIPNWQNLDPNFMKLVETADPGNAHAIIYQWGTTGLGFNVDEVSKRIADAPTDSLDLIFKPENAAKLADCGITMLDSPTDIIPIALHYLGLDPNSESPEDLQKAQDLLMSIRPYLRYLHSSQHINDLANGNVCLTLGWSGDIGIARTRAEEAGNGIVIDYSIPKEGTVVWFDMMGIPIDAPNPDQAHAFINFILEPKVMAGIDDYVGYGNAVPASWPLMDQEIAKDPRVFPPEETMRRLFAVKESSPDFDRIRTRAWTTIRTGQ